MHLFLGAMSSLINKSVYNWSQQFYLPQPSLQFWGNQSQAESSVQVQYFFTSTPHESCKLYYVYMQMQAT